MIFKYNNKAIVIDKERSIHMIQTINPFTMTPINNYEDAERWMRQYLSNELLAQPMFFSMQIIDQETESVAYEISPDKEYTFKIKESSQRLTGKYSTKLITPCNADEVKIDLLFADGEAIFNCSLNHIGQYEMEMANDFFIGENKFIAIEIENKTNAANLSLDSEQYALKFEVK